MCSIFGIKAKSADMGVIKEHFARTVSRGPDSTAYRELGGKAVFGFHRLSIIGLDESGMQPFERDGVSLVCNGEIYGFRQIRKRLEGKYEFKSDSDCEVLIPLWKGKGVSMFKELDAEFAIVLYERDSDTLVAARDPIGIRLLFYGYTDEGDIAFASEARCLIGLCKKVIPFPPGFYYINDKFVRYADPSSVDKVCHDDLGSVCRNIRDKLVEGVRKRLDSDAPMGFLLSGGLDSSLVCAIATRILKKSIRTFAIGMDSDPIDLRYAKSVADYIKSDHMEVRMTMEDVLSNLDAVISILGTWDITIIRASMGMFLCCKAIHERTDVKVLLTGEISDELFGYKYTDFAPTPDAFQNEAAKRISELYFYDVLRADRCISDNSLEARVPFGDLDFVKYVMSIDPKLKMNVYGKGKYLLRKVFENDNLLPDEILWREKAAFSDAVGHSMVDGLKQHAEEKYSDKEFEERASRYDYCRPFTKESLLYREIFEKHYPSNAEMIPDFWMPNKTWRGCDVNDPSARVLSNYGASGV
ncbi:MAG TPA: asparagine synthase B [Spirochaetaceae bacterium]|nr:asparagine synthase B [Spirochaetaceae bacterium]